MTLIKSISGIRGTIGGAPEENLTPLDAVRFAAAYGTWLRQLHSNKPISVVLGRDARLSGAMIQGLVQNTLLAQGINVLDAGLSTTPTVEMAVVFEQAQGGIILTASHNPKQWNALKLLNDKGEFVSANDGATILELVSKNAFEFVGVDDLGTLSIKSNYIQEHIAAILALPLVNQEAIQASSLSVVVDAVNSTGGLAIPPLLKALGVRMHPLYCEPTGIFPHNPEPLKEHLGDLCETVVREKADFGLVVDPDVDRLAFVDEKGQMFGEEYTLVACADYVLSKTPGNTASNLSSTRALKSITQKYGGTYTAAAVGEVNVVRAMKKTHAVIGGEGNGGIIYPELHYGRDALIGIALFLSLLAEKKQSVSSLKATYPEFFMSKKKLQLKSGMNVDVLLDKVSHRFAEHQPLTIDGIKIEFDESWVHLRKSNTEPIIRIYTEAPSQAEANTLAEKFIGILTDFI